MNAKKDGLVDRKRLLEEFGLMTEDELSVLFGVEVQTLRNRPVAQLPPFTKTGGRRMFFRDDVLTFMRDQRGKSRL